LLKNIEMNMDVNTFKSVYFIGAGGIGMSALVRYFLSKQKRVGGYDKTPSELTDKLIEEGADIHYKDSVDEIAEDFKDAATTLIVYTPAIPGDHTEFCFFKENGFQIMKRSQVLGMLTKTSKGLCVAGTHGKTTTSTMAAHLLHNSHVECNAFLGGISKNYGTNLLLSDKSDYVVIEADEFDRSFHWLTPYISVITSTDADHLDIYGTKEEYLESFRHYTSLISSDGALIIHENLELKPDVKPGTKIYTYSRESGDFHAENVRIGNGEIFFDFISPFGNIKDIQLGVPVAINIDNGIAAMAIAQMSGVSNEEIKAAMATFRGVDRRFDFKIKNDKVVFLSDYAHHPAEIKQSILSMRALYQDKKISAVFQPHLYTRTRDFYKDFADSLSLLDEVIIIDIYPAREKPIPGVTSQLIYDNLAPGVEKYMCKKEELLDLLKKKEFQVLITLGAGDIDNFAPNICDILNKR
jgi:UDP-N-acetylmuramate--alanine ligase